MERRFKVLIYSEKYYEVVDNQTNEMMERFSDGDPTTNFSAREARKQATKFARKLERKKGIWQSKEVIKNA